MRPGQLEGVESVLAGRDTPCVMATGSGKTAIYELAGLMSEGPAIVVFDSVGYRTLDAGLVAERELLAPAD